MDVSIERSEQRQDRERDEQDVLAFAVRDVENLTKVRDAGLRPEHFKNKLHGEAFDWIAYWGDGVAPNRTPHPESKVRELIAALPMRSTAHRDMSSLIEKIILTAPVAKPVEARAEQPDTGTPANRGLATQRRRPLSKKFLARRRNMRLGELKTLVKYLPRKTSIKAIEARFPGRDIVDPEQVSGREIGVSVGLTQDQMFKIEKEATDYGCAQGWSGPKRAYRFSFRTITCSD